jgi:hypothetical protein
MISVHAARMKRKCARNGIIPTLGEVVFIPG